MRAVIMDVWGWKVSAPLCSVGMRDDTLGHIGGSRVTSYVAWTTDRIAAKGCRVGTIDEALERAERMTKAA